MGNFNIEVVGIREISEMARATSGHGGRGMHLQTALNTVRHCYSDYDRLVHGYEYSYKFRNPEVDKIKERVNQEIIHLYPWLSNEETFSKEKAANL